MSGPVIHDAVTLNHFGALNRLDILESRHGGLPEPRWTEAVHEEIRKGASIAQVHCQRVLAVTWLGEPASISVEYLVEVQNLRIALNDFGPTTQTHLGEAESILLAEIHDGIFVTDDNAAYDFAQRRGNLGTGRVKDTVDVLRESVAMGEISKGQAADLASQLETHDRFLRRVHNGKLAPRYFD
ncbi:MAG: hypothetical protein ACYC06_03690 [Ilumatobacteraceae bacterium]